MPVRKRSGHPSVEMDLDQDLKDVMITILFPEMGVTSNARWSAGTFAIWEVAPEETNA